MQARASEFSAISGLLRKSDDQIAAEMIKVKDFNRLASQLALYDEDAINRIVNNLPPERRTLVKRMTMAMKNPDNQFNNSSRAAEIRALYVYHSTHINVKKILPSLIFAVILLSMSGHMV